MIAWAAVDAVVVVGVVVVIWRVHVWVARRQAEHEAWLDGIRMSDREVQELQDMARRVVREHEGRP